MQIQLEVTCKNCVYRGHSGAFTPGGSKPVCDHKEAPAAFYPGEDYAEASREWCLAYNKPNSEKTTEDYAILAKGNPGDWELRVVDINTEPPTQCPLRKFEVK